MKRFVFILFIFSAQNIFSNQLNELLRVKEILVEKVSIANLKNNQLAISMPFAKELILNPEEKSILMEKSIIKVELVFTQYKTVSSFNQKELNYKRLKELKKELPEMFEFPMWDFQLISQTNGNSRAICNNMFHGFIITYRPNSSKESLSQEADYISNLVSSFIKNDSVLNDTVTPKVFDIKTHFDKKWGYVHDTIWRLDTVKPPSPPDFFYNHSLYQDSTVLNAFNRNKNWDDFIVVTDVTGSMSPYIAQVFVWLREQSTNQKAKYFVFFNDGDDKPSPKKKPLETKGVYVTSNSSLDDVMKEATKCMRRGSGGGENLENDVEAIIEGCKHSPYSKEIVLVADNYESMRDWKYLDKIKKPVHIILCGAEKRINIQYLDLARKTRGSVHTKTEDVINLHEVKQGEHIFIDKKEYMFHEGRFHFIYN